MASILFLLQTIKNPSQIYVRIRDGREVDVKVKTPFFVDPKDWSVAKKQHKYPKDAAGKIITNGLNSIHKKISDELNSLPAKSKINKEWLEEIVKPTTKVEEELLDLSLVGRFKAYYEVKKEEDSGKIAMLKKIKSVEALVNKYQNKLKKPILLKEVDVNWMSNFEKFMRSLQYKQGYIFRVVKFIKMVCKSARNLGLETSLSLDSIKSKDKKAFKTFLDENELSAIENAKMPSESLENSRDWLIISCHLGQRVSDLMRCNSSKIMVKGDKMALDLRQKKTDKAVMVAIFPKVLKYLEKRNGEFPRPISSQNYNYYIKEVCKIAGLTHLEEGSLHDAKTNRDIDGMYEKWQIVTSHVGRRSFATNYYGIVPTPLLMAQTGHTTERAFLEYIGKGSLDQTWQLLEYIENKQK